MRARVRRRTGPLAELDAHLPGEQSALAPLAGVPSGCAGFTPRVAAYPPRPRRYEEKDLRNLSAFSYSPHSSSLRIRAAVPESMPAGGARGGLIGREPACGGAAIAVYADGPGTRSGYAGAAPERAPGATIGGAAGCIAGCRPREPVVAGPGSSPNRRRSSSDK